ncbi:MAG: hypothetical protein CL607_09360 [Anaerolineaceae bacterium]|nr:hypothetical protein [Anaerolineaceae bacterium]
MPHVMDPLMVDYTDAPALLYPYVRHEPRENNTLVVLLPGRGYLNSHPLMHYNRLIALQHQHDVLSIDYRFQQTNVDFQLKDMPTLIAESVQAIKQAAADYDEVFVVAKSLGTLIVPALVGEVANLRALMLTPVGSSMADIGDTPALAIIGTADQAYVPEKATDTATATWRVYEGLNHGLQYAGDWVGSLRVLGEILAGCEDFLLRGNSG